MFLPESKKRVIHAEDDIGTSKIKIRRNEEPHLPHISIVDKAYEQISSIPHVILASAHLLVNILFLLSWCFLSLKATRASILQIMQRSDRNLDFVGLIFSIDIYDFFTYLTVFHVVKCSISPCQVKALISSEIVARSFLSASCNNQTECNASMQTTE